MVSYPESDKVANGPCAPPSGSTFPLGSTPVTSCTAPDGLGTEQPIDFAVIVTDKTAPVISVPAPTAEATGASGAVVDFSVTAADLVDGSVPVTCDHHSHDTYPIGSTPVSCSATDAHGNSSSGSFAVIVTDKTAPVISVPAPIVTQASSSSGAVVAYGATALDLVDGPVAVACLPASGTVFAVGITTVTCNAKDTKNNAATPKTFTVTVTAPPTSGGSPPPPTTTTTTTAPFTPPSIKKPQAVSNFTVKPGDRRVVVVWKLPAGDGLHVELVRTIGSGAPKTIYNGTSLSFADTRLQNGKHYSYSIVVVDASGNRSDSVSQNATPTALPLVSPAVGARVTAPPTLLWVPKAKATYYNVQLFRGGQKILSVWPGSNSYKLKRHWVFGGREFTLSPGEYRWYVWPGFGPHRDKKYGNPLGNSTFQVTG